MRRPISLGHGHGHYWDVPTDGDLAALLDRDDLPPGFERWRVVLAPGEGRLIDHATWAGALVLVESGRLAVGCPSGACRTFAAGDMVALGALGASRIDNDGRDRLRLLAVRRRKVRSPA